MAEEETPIARKVSSERLSFMFIVALAIGSAVILTTAWSLTASTEESLALPLGPAAPKHDPVVILSRQRERLTPQTVKGLYLTAYSAGNPKKIADIIELIDHTELNAIVIDIKDYSGYVLYDSAVPLVVADHLKDNRLHDVPALYPRIACTRNLRHCPSNRVSGSSVSRRRTRLGHP